MPSDDRLFINEIDSAIARIDRHIGGMSEADFKADEKTFDAVVRVLAVISEASRGLSQELKNRHSAIDWVAIRDAGNFYRHAYRLVTEERVWDTATKHLEPLRVAVLAELARLDK